MEFSRVIDRDEISYLQLSKDHAVLFNANSNWLAYLMMMSFRRVQIRDAILLHFD